MNEKHSIDIITPMEQPTPPYKELYCNDCKRYNKCHFLDDKPYIAGNCPLYEYDTVMKSE